MSFVGLPDAMFFCVFLRGEFFNSHRPLHSKPPALDLNECNREWLLKNPISRNWSKKLCARMPCKRRSRFWWTFAVPPPGPFFQKRGFFNSHGIFRQSPTCQTLSLP